MLVLIVLALSPVIGSRFLPQVHAQSSGVSAVNLSPINSCCIPHSVGSSYTIGVMLNLTAGESMNEFEVRLNYSNFYNPPFTPNGVIRAASIDYSSNIFASVSPSVLTECIDGIPVDSQICQNDDIGPGWLHFQELAQGNGRQGPITNGLLFSIVFTIRGNGTSIFSFNRINILNPSVDSFGPHPHFVQYTARSGVFSNKGIAAFFNVEPVSPPAIVPGPPGVMFDATGSYDADQPSLTILNYTWSFGDGSPPSTSLISKVPHTFTFPGNYSVRLVVADQSGRGNLTRIVKVLPNLGSLRLEVRDQLGIPMRGNVFVLLFNSSSSPSPFERAITSPIGVVLLFNLSPGLYSLDFSGQNVVAGHRVSEKVIGGWETADTVYVTVDTPPIPPDYSGIVFIASILAGLSLFTVAIILKRRSERRKLKPGMPRRSAR